MSCTGKTATPVRPVNQVGISDLVIVDCDGVLADSKIIASEIKVKLLTEPGYPISTGETAERFAAIAGLKTCMSRVPLRHL